MVVALAVELSATEQKSVACPIIKDTATVPPALVPPAPCSVPCIGALHTWLAPGAWPMMEPRKKMPPAMPITTGVASAAPRHCSSCGRPVAAQADAGLLRAASHARLHACKPPDS